MENNASNTSNIWYFICGFGLGTTIGLYYNAYGKEEQTFSVRVLSADGSINNNKYHLNKTSNIIYFQEKIIDSEVRITINGIVKKKIYHFTGNQITL